MVAIIYAKDSFLWRWWEPYHKGSRSKKTGSISKKKNNGESGVKDRYTVALISKCWSRSKRKKEIGCNLLRRKRGTIGPGVGAPKY